MIEKLAAIVEVLGTVEALGIVMLLFAAVFLFMAHRSETNPIDFAHTLQDSSGKTSLRKLGEWIALLVSSWLMVFLAKRGQMTEGYFGVYLLVWVLRAAAGPILSAKAAAIANGHGGKE